MTSFKTPVETIASAPVHYIDEYKYHASIANKLLDATYDLNRLELLIVFLGLHGADSTKLDEEDQNIINSIVEERVGNMYVFSTKKYANYAGTDVSRSFECFKKAAVYLKQRELRLFDETGEIRLNWIITIKFFSDNDRIGVQYHPALAPYLFNLGKGIPFTKVYTQALLSLKSKYAVRLGLEFEKYRWHKLEGEIILDLEDLYTRWCIPEKSRVYPIFYRNILKPAIAELLDKGYVNKLSLTKLLDNKKVKELKFSYTINSMQGGRLARGRQDRRRKGDCEHDQGTRSGP